MIFDLVYRNRSYRRFHEEKRLTRAQLIELIKVARYIPSAFHSPFVCAISCPANPGLK